MVVAKFSEVMLEGKAAVYISFVVASCGNRAEICKLSIYLFLEMFSGINKSHAVNRNWPPSLCSPLLQFQTNFRFFMPKPKSTKACR